jgi:hypothetical protein
VKETVEYLQILVIIVMLFFYFIFYVPFVLLLDLEFVWVYDIKKYTLKIEILKYTSWKLQFDI